MSKASDQKLKILYLLGFFAENTDENHPATMVQIIEYLSSKGINAERRSIYSDIEALQMMDYDIIYRKEQPAGYFMGARNFELAELKLLVDAVQSCKFITEKKSDSLISKIEKLTSRYEGRKLQRQVYVANRVKSANNSVLYIIDDIHEAINGQKRIQFQYCEWTMSKELVPRKDGKYYTAEPLMLVWDDENYYLVAYDPDDKIIKHFRVDKMASVKMTAGRREFNPLNGQFDPGEYSKEHFGMFNGESRVVSVRFPNSLIGVVLDRFGRDVTIIKGDNDTFSARLKVRISDRFFSWIAGFRGKAVIESPKEAVCEYKAFIEDIRNSFYD